LVGKAEGCGTDANAGARRGSVPRGRSAEPRGPIWETVMKTFKLLAKRLVTDEAGGEVLEYALIAGLIIVGAIAVITAVGTKVLAKWTAVSDGLD
jgi:pilus assembly protein Flp/PilA